MLKFCNEFTFYDQHCYEGVIEVNHVRDHIANVSFPIDFTEEDICIRVLSVKNYMSLMTIEKDVVYIGGEINILRVGI